MNQKRKKNPSSGPRISVCPSDVQWRQYLNEELTISRQQKLDQHLLSCQHCAQKLSELMTGPSAEASNPNATVLETEREAIKTEVQGLLRASLLGITVDLSRLSVASERTVLSRLDAFGFTLVDDEESTVRAYAQVDGSSASAPVNAHGVETLLQQVLQLAHEEPEAGFFLHVGAGKLTPDKLKTAAGMPVPMSVLGPVREALEGLEVDSVKPGVEVSESITTELMPRGWRFSTVSAHGFRPTLHPGNAWRALPRQGQPSLTLLSRGAHPPTLPLLAEVRVWRAAASASSADGPTLPQLRADDALVAHLVLPRGTLAYGLLEQSERLYVQENGAPAAGTGDGSSLKLTFKPLKQAGLVRALVLLTSAALSVPLGELVAAHTTPERLLEAAVSVLSEDDAAESTVLIELGRGEVLAGSSEA